MITFEYKGKIYSPSNLENKLKKLGVTINDVKILKDSDVKQQNTSENLSYHQVNDIPLNIWYNTSTKESAVCVISVKRDAPWKLLGSTRTEDGKIETVKEAEHRLLPCDK